MNKKKYFKEERKMVCVNCGKDAGGGDFCVNCGVSLSVQKAAEKERLEKHLQSASAGGGVSDFNAGGLDFLLIGLVAYFGTLFTLGLATPWIICYAARYFAPKITISGRPIKFNGTGGKLFPIYIIGILLTIVTLGIYSFWFIRNVYRFIIQNTEAL